MQSKLQQILSDLCLRLLEKSRTYYHVPTRYSEVIEEDLNDEEYAVLLAEIDQFSAQFLTQQKQTGLEETSPVYESYYDSGINTLARAQ